MVIHIHGLRRSGLHCITHWICMGFKNRKIYYFNDIGRCSRKAVRKKCKTIQKRKADILIFGFEDFDFRNNSKKFLSVIPPGDLQIIILRDPFNWFSSYIKRFVYRRVGSKRLLHSKYVLDLWKYYIESIIDQSSFLFVPFNRWFLSKDYRVELSSQIGINNNKECIKMIPRHGGGSSFDRKKYNGRANEMDLMNRWRMMKDDPYFQLVKSRYFFEKSREIFNFLPEMG